jgi:hypothetical protein
MSDRDWDVSDAMLFSLSDVRNIMSTLSNNFKQVYNHVDVHVSQASYLVVKNQYGDEATVYLSQFGRVTLELGMDEPVRLTFRTGTSTNDVIDQIYTSVLSHVPADHELTGELRQAGRRDLALTGELRQAGRRDLAAVLRSLHARLERLESAASP